ncbi:hypothetical protein BC835DRAFT_1001170 [Cytidiella melzeri]|nr:hypothetical protein BC835DRAFT_1001170 [Cytidiella melzeri]
MLVIILLHGLLTGLTLCYPHSETVTACSGALEYTIYFNHVVHGSLRLLWSFDEKEGGRGVYGREGMIDRVAG